jgi:large subunit ribosomal protein L13
VGIPKEFETQETSRIPEAEPTNITRSVKLGTVSQLLGSKF